MKKELFPDLKKKVAKAGNQAKKVTFEAKKTAEAVRDIAHTGVDASKAVMGKALHAGSKGAELAGKGVRAASEGAGVVANSLEKTAKKIKDLGNFLNKK